jgi:hypothetical protein
LLVLGQVRIQPFLLQEVFFTGAAAFTGAGAGAGPRSKSENLPIVLIIVSSYLSGNEFYKLTKNLLIHFLGLETLSKSTFDLSLSSILSNFKVRILCIEH